MQSQRNPEKHSLPKDYTRITREWLNQRFDVVDSDGVYVPNQPSYGYSAASFRLEEYARTAAVLGVLDRIRFESLLDAGSADGYFPALVQQLSHSIVLGADLSDRAVLRGCQMYGVSGAAFDMHAMPFSSGSVDVVTCTEVLEHVIDPVAALAELIRVARHCVVISTPRARNLTDVTHHFESLDSGEPHAHIHYFTDDAIRHTVRAALRRNGCSDTPPPRFLGARHRWFARWYDRVAWESGVSLKQRQAYLQFTLDSTAISQDSRTAMTHALLDKYASPTPAWRKWLGSPACVKRYLAVDTYCSNRFPALAHDHLVVIPLSRKGIPGSSRMGITTAIRIMIESFFVPPLRITCEDSAHQS